MPIIPVAGQAMLGHFGRELEPRTPLRNIKTDALRDAEQIEFYSRQHPNALYAILMENRVVNIDVEGGLDKNGKDGWSSIFEMGLEVSSPYELPSISCGTAKPVPVITSVLWERAWWGPWWATSPHRCQAQR